MKKLFSFIALALPTVIVSLPNHAHAQALYNNGATLNITSGTQVYVVGDLTNDATATLANSGTLRVTGNTVNNGSFTSPSASNLTLEGTGAQTLSGTSPINAKDVTLNNSAGITLSTPLQVDGAFTFTSGNISAASAGAPLIFTANGTVSATPTDASHVNGYVQKLGTGAFTYPVGNATKYQPVAVNLSANSAGMTARYVAADAGSAPFGTGGSSSTPLLYYNTKEYWDLAPAGMATGTVTIYFDSYNNVGIGSTTDLRVAHKSGGQFLNEGGAATGTPSAGTVTSNSISTFSPFTLGSVSNGSPLPVRLIAFSAKGDGAANRIDWQTAVEDAGTAFSIERSATGISFEAIGSTTGKGPNSAYTFYDREPLASLSYYRLKMMEAGGTVSYSSTVMLRRNTTGGAQVIVYPVPASDALTISNGDAALEGSTTTVLDAHGKVMTSFSLQSTQRISLSNWPAGIYTLRLADGTAVKIVKQ